MQTSSPLDIAEKAKKARGELCYEQRQLISDLHGQYLDDRARCTKEDLIDLTGKVWLALTHLSYLFICFSRKFSCIALNHIVLIRSRADILTQAGYLRKTPYTKSNLVYVVPCGVAIESIASRPVASHSNSRTICAGSCISWTTTRTSTSVYL